MTDFTGPKNLIIAGTLRRVRRVRAKQKPSPVYVKELKRQRDRLLRKTGA